MITPFTIFIFSLTNILGIIFATAKDQWGFYGVVVFLTAVGLTLEYLILKRNPDFYKSSEY